MCEMMTLKLCSWRWSVARETQPVATEAAAWCSGPTETVLSVMLWSINISYNLEAEASHQVFYSADFLQFSYQLLALIFIYKTI